MKYMFFGTPEFAAIVLEKLITAGLPPAAVVCNPDRPVGRKKIITPPPVKLLAQKHNITVRQPEKLEVGNCPSSAEVDLAIVAAYAKIIPKEILQIPRLGVVGVHPSLLPKYRGPSPIQSAILNGEEETGVTLYLLDERVDHGSIVASEKLKMKNENHLELQKKLAELGGNLLVKILPKFVEGKIKPQPQNEAEATYTKKFITEDGFVNEKDLNVAQKGLNTAITQRIERKIRALNPEPGVWTIQSDKRQEIRDKGNAEKRVKLLEAVVENNRLVIKKIQEEGGRPKLPYSIF